MHRASRPRLWASCLAPHCDTNLSTHSLCVFACLVDWSFRLCVRLSLCLCRVNDASSSPTPLLCILRVRRPKTDLARDDALTPGFAVVDYELTLGKPLRLSADTVRGGVLEYSRQAGRAGGRGGTRVLTAGGAGGRKRGVLEYSRQAAPAVCRHGAWCTVVYTTQP